MAASARSPHRLGSRQVENQATEDGDWARIRRSREAFVDLQAFLPDDEASAAESFVSSSSHDRSDDKPGQDALERVTWAQAIAISLLRDDEKVVGSYNALNQIDIVIGEAQASLEVVDRHKESQAIGFAAFVILPISIVVGAAVGSFLWGLTLSSVASAAILAALSFLAAPWYGWLAGGLSSRLDRRAMRSDHMRVVVIGRSAATVVSFILYFVLPVVFGIGVARVCTALGLP